MTAEEFEARQEYTEDIFLKKKKKKEKERGRAREKKERMGKQSTENNTYLNTSLKASIKWQPCKHYQLNFKLDKISAWLEIKRNLHFSTRPLSNLLKLHFKAAIYISNTLIFPFSSYWPVNCENKDNILRFCFSNQQGDQRNNCHHHFYFFFRND